MSSAQTIPDAIEAGAARWPEYTALQIFQGGALKGFTYGEVVDRSRQNAERLKASGIGAGDRIVLLAENLPAWPVACLGALWAGATVVPLDPALSPADLEILIDKADPRALMLSQAQFEALAPAIQFDLPVFNIEKDLTPFEGTAHLLVSEKPPSSDPDAEAALLIFTSGTMGVSKGVLLGHAALMHTALACVEAVEQDAHEAARILCVLPLHHVTGFTVNFLGGLLAGATLTFVETLSAEAILATMQETQTSVLPGVPRLFELFYTEIRRKVAAKGVLARGVFRALCALCALVRRLTPWNPGPVLFRTVHQAFGGSLRLCCSGAAPLPQEVLQGLERLGFNVIEAYGLTETSGVATVNSVSQRRPGTVGLPVGDTRIRIANPTPSSGEGEICIRGPILMRGYFRDEAATREVVRDGWLHTGDLGRLDHRGYLTVTGRLKELIVTPGGKNVSPLEVERRYGDLPGVVELAVFGMPATEGYGEDVHAAVVLDPEADGLRQTVEAAVQERAPDIPSYMRIQRLRVVPELPKTTTLKVKRAELRQMGAVLDTRKKKGGQKSLPDALHDEVAQRVLTVVQEAMREADETRQVTLDATLQFELGVDSLGLIELAARLESALGVHLDERQLPALYTVADLVRAVKAGLDGDDERAPAPLQDVLSDGRSEPVLPPRGLLARMSLCAFGLISRCVWKLEVHGQEYIPAQGPFILCPNHESHFDFFMVASCLRPIFRGALCCFAKREHFEHFGTRLIARLACAIPTDRDGDILPALRAGAKVLRAGRPLLIHPEGTRTRTGHLGPFRGGAARLALAAGVPLVPVRIVGAYGIFPVHRPLPRIFNWRRWRRHKLGVIFGPPILPGNGDQTDTGERQLTQCLRRAVKALGD